MVYFAELKDFVTADSERLETPGVRDSNLPSMDGHRPHNLNSNRKNRGSLSSSFAFVSCFVRRQIAPIAFCSRWRREFRLRVFHIAAGPNALASPGSIATRLASLSSYRKNKVMALEFAKYDLLERPGRKEGQCSRGKRLYFRRDDWHLHVVQGGEREAQTLETVTRVTVFCRRRHGVDGEMIRMTLFFYRKITSIHSFFQIPGRFGTMQLSTVPAPPQSNVDDSSTMIPTSTPNALVSTEDSEANDPNSNATSTEASTSAPESMHPGQLLGSDCKLR